MTAPSINVDELASSHLMPLPAMSCDFTTRHNVLDQREAVIQQQSSSPIEGQNYACMLDDHAVQL